MKKQKPLRRSPLGERRPFSPVVFADLKLFGLLVPCVDVRFESVAQLDAFIASLVALRESPGDSLDHVHLQDGSGGQLRRASAEIVFHRPRLDRDYTVRACIRAYIRDLANLLRLRPKDPSNLPPEGLSGERTALIGSEPGRVQKSQRP